MRISDWSSDVCSSDLQAEDPVRLVRIARPYLLAVDKPVIALVLRTALKTDEIRTGARLRIALCPADSALGDVGQEATLLIFRAIFEQRKIGRASCRERVCQYV